MEGLQYSVEAMMNMNDSSKGNVTEPGNTHPKQPENSLTECHGKGANDCTAVKVPRAGRHQPEGICQRE